jgi:hypothetical protein
MVKRSAYWIFYIVLDGLRKYPDTYLNVESYQVPPATNQEWPLCRCLIMSRVLSYILPKYALYSNSALLAIRGNLRTRVILGKTMFFQLVYKLLTFHVTQRVHCHCFKRIHHWTPSWLIGFNLRRYVIFISNQFQYYSPFLVKIISSSASPVNIIYGFLAPSVCATWPTHFILWLLEEYKLWSSSQCGFLRFRLPQVLIRPLNLSVMNVSHIQNR